MRKFRKREHIEAFLRSSHEGDSLLNDVFLYHNALPECNFNEIDMSTTFLNKEIGFPLMINAITGGTEFTCGINESLAKIAKFFNIPMAIGSETIAIETNENYKSFQIAREVIGDGILIGNINGRTTVEDAKKAAEIIQADAMQIHLNSAQEIVMKEGERDFRNILSNIKDIVENLEVPVIIKEVGFGMSKIVAHKLYDAGVRYIDVSGYGGTNFIEIENLRSSEEDYSDLYSWGIPTAVSLIDINSLNYDGLTLIGSGGLKTSTDVLKSIVIGASITAMSGEILTYVVRGGVNYTIEFLENLIKKFKMLMLFTGAKNISEVKNLKYKVTGKLKELID